MKTSLFSQAMSEVRDKYYEEAASFECQRTTHTWIKWSATAVCLAVLVLVVFSMQTEYLHQQGVTQPDKPNDVISKSF